MAFDANRHIKIEASETASGRYVLRTRGLADRQRPELEIAGVAEVALNAAGGVINMIAEYTVNKAEVLVGQSVGNVLTIGEDSRRLLLVVRAVAAEPAKSGFWSKLAGGGSKGVLRLVDVTGGDDDAPLTALATMLVHRAAVRLAKDDEDTSGAREELDAAIATFPGEPNAGQPPSIDGADGDFNWQNHLAYADLAKLAGDDIAQAATRFGEALARSDVFARHELASTAAELTSLGEGDIEREATRIIEHNLAQPARAPGPTAALVALASPIWELGDDDQSVRRMSLLPEALVALYYEGLAAERLRRDGASLVTKVLEPDRRAPWRPAWIARETRGIWISDEAPFAGPVGASHPAHGIVSMVLADLARCFRAGATDDEILARYRPPAPGGERSPALDAVDKKLDVLATWAGERYMAAMSV